jgi:hypothetical protein
MLPTAFEKKMQYFFSTGTICNGLKTGLLPSELNDEPPADLL